MKSLLIVTELFDVGGLETHVAGAVECLSAEGLELHLATGVKIDAKFLPRELTSLTSGLAMGPATTIAELIATVESLREIIRHKSIECVHAHPFTSLIPSFIAAELEGVPIVVTLHGPASLSDCYGPIYDFLLTSVVLPKADMIVVVSQEMADLARPYADNKNIKIIPNGIPIDKFSISNELSSESNKWLLVSRLDAQKIIGIRDFILKSARAGLPGILLVGDGDARELLEEQLESDGLSNFVKFLGAKIEIPSLMRQVIGVAGMGRVALEGLACGKPVMLVGYDGVKGLLSIDNFYAAAQANFSGRYLKNIDFTNFSRQMHDFASPETPYGRLTEIVRSEYSDVIAWQGFFEEIRALKPHGRSILSDTYVELASESHLPPGPYLYSKLWLDKLDRLVNSFKNFDGSIVGSYRFNREKFMNISAEQESNDLRHKVVELCQSSKDLADRVFSLSERIVAGEDSRVDLLVSRLSERESRIEALHHVMAERDNQACDLSQVISQRDGQVTDLNLAIIERDGQIASLNQAVAERDDRIVSLSQVVVGHDAQIASLSQAVVVYDGQVATLNRVIVDLKSEVSHILHSNSWRITSPARFLLRVLRYGFGEPDKVKILFLLRKQYRRFPLSFRLKNIVRKAFFRITGWSSYTPLVQSLSASDLAAGMTAMATASLAGQAQSTIAIPCDAPHQIKPYFGVRRPHGKRRAAILTNQLLDWHDGRPRFGGGERYALELARLLRELSIEVTFFQPSLRSGSGVYYSFEVKLLPLGDSIGEFHHGVCSRFTELTEDYDHVYYHLPEYASGVVREDGLMTCHGIWFDHNNYPDSIFRTAPWFEQLYRAFNNPSGVISVDTNSIGVIRSLWPELAQKMRFIPNFYDVKSYYPDSTKRDPARLTILFPRRSQINRGSRIFGDIVDRIKHDVDIIWVGEGDPIDTQIVKDVCARDKRTNFYVADFDQMPVWYQKADIVVIPTLACEGTSLSCIEALASGCAVISTNVGGLPDIVYDGINGLLVEPEASSLAAAVNRLIEDKALRERLQLSGAETAGNFELQMWRARWVELLRGFGWVSDAASSAWLADNHSATFISRPLNSQKWAILTRNAIHGGVESLIREQSRLLDAPVIVCGGHDQKNTCPFEYSRADDARALEKAISEYDIILYHWVPDWALEVIRKSHKTSLEFVHRADTSESNKAVPTALVTHSAFLAEYIHVTYGRLCRVVDHPIALDQFMPRPELGPCIGAITSYYETKGIDIFLRAWALLKNEFPDMPVRFYGAGDDRHRFRRLADELGIDVEFRDATREPWRVMQEFCCFVVPSRIEGLPVAMLEALSMNIPVVASALPGMQEFNSIASKRGYQAYVHLANPEDPEDLARAIRAVLKSDVREDSNHYIRDYYSPSKHCSDLAGIIGEISRH